MPDGQPEQHEPNRLAYMALFLGIISLLAGITAIPAIIVGFIAVGRAAHREGTGRWPAMAGLGLGVISLVVVLPLCIFGYLTYNSVQQWRASRPPKQDIQLYYQIAFAQRSQAMTNGQFETPYYSPSNMETPLANPSDRMSWRLALLPHLGQQNLFAAVVPSFAWDAPVNKPVADSYLNIFADSGNFTNQTRIRAIVGPGMFFEENKKLTLNDITDGLSNTIAIMEASDTVPWLQYNEVTIRPGDPTPAFGRNLDTSFFAIFADGSVRPIRKDVNPTALRGALTRAGGELLPQGWDTP